MTTYEIEKLVQKYWKYTKLRKGKMCPFSSCSQLLLQQGKQAVENT